MLKGYHMAVDMVAADDVFGGDCFAHDVLVGLN